MNTPNMPNTPLAATPTPLVFAAYVGLDWGDEEHAVSLAAAGSDRIERSTLEQTPEALAAWASELRQRFPGGKIAVCLEQAREPLIYGLQCYEHLVLYPINPKTPARLREALYPSHAKDDPMDANLALELVCKHRAHFRQIGTLFASLPDAAIFQSLPGAGPVLAPRLLAALGTDRNRYPSALAVNCASGIAPVIEKSGKFAGLKMAVHTKIVTDDQKSGGILTVGVLVIDGKSIPQAVYTSAEPWILGSGFVVVGDVKYVNAAGVIDNANTLIGENNIAVLTAATIFGPATGNCAIPVRMGEFGLTFRAAGDKPTSYSGFITGNGGVTLDACTVGPSASRQPLELTGPASSSYRGPTLLSREVLKLNKPAGAIAIPGNLFVGGSEAANAGDGVVFAADGQISPAAIVTLNGKVQPCFLDLAGHRSTLAKVVMDGQAKIRTGTGGQLAVKQVILDGKKVAAGIHKAPQPWLEGDGTVAIDPHVDIKGRYGDPTLQIGSGNIGNMIGDTEFWVGVGTCDIDLVSNGHAITFDSGDGNPLCYMGTISGTGDVVLLMGPSYTGYKDAPLRLAGDKPNTTTGKFIARKGRVQLEKPDGVDAISSDVIVGGQGFNDCLHWINSNQIKDTATITVINAGNSGGAYLSLNGCSETVAALVMASNTTVKTDSADGKSGVLTAKSLTINNVKKPAGTYTSAAEKWIEGKGKVVVAP